MCVSFLIDFIENTGILAKTDGLQGRYDFKGYFALFTNLNKSFKDCLFYL